MNEDVLAAIIRLNETEALLVVEPLHGTAGHENLSLLLAAWPRTCATG
jgi:hypothetical protein